MQTLVYTLTSTLLVAVAAYLLVKSYGKNGSFVRALGYGFLFTPIMLWFGFGRYIVVAWYQLPFVCLAAALFTGALIYMLRLPRKFGLNPEKGDLLDIGVDKLIDMVNKR